MTNFETMKPAEIESHFADLITELFSEAHDVNITSHKEHFYLSFEYDGVNHAFKFKSERAGRVADQLRAIKGALGANEGYQKAYEQLFPQGTGISEFNAFQAGWLARSAFVPDASEVMAHDREFVERAWTAIGETVGDTLRSGKAKDHFSFGVRAGWNARRGMSDEIRRWAALEKDDLPSMPDTIEKWFYQGWLFVMSYEFPR